MGFHPVVIFFTSQIAVLFQFWVHTEYIRKLHPFIEYILATPSNHRVHHGSQPTYINKNYGATFVLWDRIFKTYQKEEEQVQYGITEEITKHSDPIHIYLERSFVHDKLETKVISFSLAIPEKLLMTKK
jgi:sterol desaturase/sphingolipid hydroxylase (fatty acid hydroxylase superfamily)